MNRVDLGGERGNGIGREVVRDYSTNRQDVVYLESNWSGNDANPEERRIWGFLVKGLILVWIRIVGANLKVDSRLIKGLWSIFKIGRFSFNLFWQVGSDYLRLRFDFFIFRINLVGLLKLDLHRMRRFGKWCCERIVIHILLISFRKLFGIIRRYESDQYLRIDTLNQLLGFGKLVHISANGSRRFSSSFFSLLCFYNTLKSLFSLCFWCLRLTMTQGQWVTKSGGKMVEANKPCLKITVPRFDNSDLIASYDKTLIGRCMNPHKQDMKVLLFMLPRIWQVEERVVGTDLGMGRFQFVFQEEEDIAEVLKMEPFHFDYWMVSLVRWKPVLEVHYPSRIIFWVRVMDIPLQFRAAQTFRSVGEAIGEVQGEVDLREGRVRVELDGFKPLVFSMAVEFEEGVEIMVSLRYEKLFGFCRECFCMTHDQSRCPKLQEEVETMDNEKCVKTEARQQASSYKGAVTNGNGLEGASRDGQQHRAPLRSGNKGKGIARERPGPYKQAGTYQAYKERLPRGYGDGSSFRGRHYGNHDRRNVTQYSRNGEDGHQKLMMDAFKGVSRSSSQVVSQTSGVKKSGETPKACKALLFNEDTVPEVSKEEEVVEVLKKEQKELANVQAKRVPEGMFVQGTEETDETDSNPLDDANLMVEGAILSDSDLLVDVEEEEYKEWEQGEITDFMEEEDVMVHDKEAAGDKVDTEQEAAADAMGEEERDNNDESLEKAPKKKGGRPGPLAVGGSTKMRLVQNLVSPRKKNAAKIGGKTGDKGAGASKKATMKPKTSE